MWWLWFACSKATMDTSSIQQDTADEMPTIDVARVPAGEFQMGCTEGDDACADNERPSHTVVLTRDYFVMTTEVTQELYEWVTGENPAEFTLSGQYPVEEVTWYDAVEFANGLSELEGREVCYEVLENELGELQVNFPNSLDCTGWRLPTEAEWEYAARGGEDFVYAGSSTLDDIAWYEDNADQQSHAVGLKAPNGYGLFDMSGNLEEWCWDGYDESLYATLEAEGTVTDPIGPFINNDRILRGGGWGLPPHFMRVSNRVVVSAENLRRIFGFRLVRTAE